MSLSHQNQNCFAVSNTSLPSFVIERNSKFVGFKILGHPLPHDLLFRATQGPSRSRRYGLYLMLRTVSESSALSRLDD